MHKVLDQLANELDEVAKQLQTNVSSNEPFGNAHGNWAFPGVTRDELILDVRSIAEEIRQSGGDILSSEEAHLNDFVRRLQFLRTNTIPNLWSNAGAGVPAVFFTLRALQQALKVALPSTPAEEVARTIKRLTVQVRAMEARLVELEPRSTNLAAMVGRIEAAHEAADRLPADLLALEEARRKVTEQLRAAERDTVLIEQKKQEADTLTSKLRTDGKEAEDVLKQCEHAYSASTSVGLAAAFSERSSSLGSSLQAWVFGLVIALGAGSYLGSGQLKVLGELVKTPEAPWPLIIVNLLLALLSVGAPVWFAWLATKQIGHRFKLAEDYAFKASISRAYEGYRREAARVDKALESRLLASALTRLDELPLRVMDGANPGSPLHEFAYSDVVREAVRAVPGFGAKMADLARDALSKVRAGTSAKPPAAANVTPSNPS